MPDDQEPGRMLHAPSSDHDGFKPDWTATIWPLRDGLWLDSRGYTFQLIEAEPSDVCTDSEGCDEFLDGYQRTYFRCLNDPGVIHTGHFKIVAARPDEQPGTPEPVGP